MNQNIIILRYGELHLKGKNRGFFEKKLIDNIKFALQDISCDFVANRGRYEITNYQPKDQPKILDKMSCIFGLHSFSIAKSCDSDIESITQLAVSLYNSHSNGNTPNAFKIETHRADKTFALTSLQTSREIGGRLLTHCPNATVDVHKPQITINIDIRENKKTFVYTTSHKGLGGLPYGTAGKGLALLSGGIDSPVALFMMAKRGLELTAIHFWSYPYTSESAKQKVVDLTNILSQYCPKLKLYIVPFTQIQEAIRDNCEPNYMITLIRRTMMRISQALAQKLEAKAIVNGECLGQVASQTLESLVVTNSAVDIPVLRPLIGFDKQEIIQIANQINTYPTSILPYEDCCTIFMPDHPATKPTLDKAIQNEQKIPNLDQLIQTALQQTHLHP